MKRQSGATNRVNSTANEGLVPWERLGAKSDRDACRVVAGPPRKKNVIRFVALALHRGDAH